MTLGSILASQPIEFMPGDASGIARPIVDGTGNMRHWLRNNTIRSGFAIPRHDDSN
jgi:hypothetical protein